MLTVAGVLGLEPRNAGIRIRCLTNLAIPQKIEIAMAGVAGFEPTDDGIKTRCLTTWRYPCMVATTRIELVTPAL